MKDTQLTIKEFKMWLSGVEEMQEDGWVPTAAQWAKIREKIDNIAEGAPAPQINQSSFEYPTPSAGVAPAVPSGPSSMPAGPIPRAPAPPPSGPLFGTGGNSAVKTPNIDTSQNGYESSFV